MIFQFAVIALTSQSATPVAELLDQAGFVLTYEHPGEDHRSLSFKQGNTGARLDIQWRPMKAGNTPEDALKSWKFNSARWDNPPLEMPSKLPVAGIVLDGTRGTSKYINFATRPAVGRVYLQGKITQVSGQPTYSGINAETAPKLLEGLVRWIIATESGAKFTPGNITADGHTYQAFKDASGKWHIDAKAWAERHGWTYSENFTEGRIQFTTPLGNFLLPLGSEKVKLGDTWHTLPLLISARDRRILLSPEARQLASQ